jgi:peroxiredoxin
MTCFLRYILNFSILFFFFPKSYAQDSFTLVGTIPKSYNATNVSLTSPNPSFKRLEGIINDGQFSISGNLNDKYEYVYLLIKEKGTDERVLVYLEFFINPGIMRININELHNAFNEKDITYENIPFIKDLETYKSFNKVYNDSIKNAYNLYQKSRILNGSKQVADSLLEIFGHLKEKRMSKQISFFKTISDSYLGLYFFNRDIFEDISSYKMNVDTLVRLFNLFDSSVKGSNLGKSIWINLEKMNSLQVGNILPTFSFLSTNGDYISLNDFKNNKIVLLCFWDAGCRPCIESFPTLKRFNNQYESKGLQIISISVDNSEDQWKKALTKYNLPWTQTCDLPQYIKDPQVRSLYNITYIPQYFLIDKNGRLLYHNNQMNDNDNYDVLDNMLKQIFEEKF